MFIKPTKEVKGNIFDIHDDAMDLLIYPTTDEVPCPWDADISIENGKVILVGSLGPSGPKGAYCRCECLVSDFTKYYKLEAPDDNDDLLNALSDAGWERA